jgi:hypothetical protein
MAPSRRAPAASRRIGAVHVPLRPAAISSRRRRLWNLPNPSRPGKTNPLLAYPPPEERGKKRRRGSQEQRRHRGAVPAPPPRRRSCPRGGAGPAGATNALDLGPLDFLAAIPLCAPYQRRLPPRHCTAALHRRVYTPARGHLGEGIRFPSLVDAPAIAPRWNAPCPRRRAIAGEAGLRARLGRILQVPLPSSTRTPPA